MGLVYQEIPSHEIERELRNRGYGLDSCPGYQFRLTLPTGVKRKTDGRNRQEPLGGIPVRDYLTIRKTSNDTMQAADRVIKICKGQSPGSVEMPTNAAQIDYDMISRQIRNNVETQTADLRAQLSAMQDGMQRILDAISPAKKAEPVKSQGEPAEAVSPVPLKRKRGRPRKHPLPGPGTVTVSTEVDGEPAGEWAPAGQTIVE